MRPIKIGGMNHATLQDAVLFEYGVYLRVNSGRDHTPENRLRALEKLFSELVMAIAARAEPDETVPQQMQHVATEWVGQVERAP